MHAVDAGLDQAPRQGRQGIARVDGDGPILWFLCSWFSNGSESLGIYPHMQSSVCLFVLGTSRQTHHPFPLAFIVQNLKPTHGLPKQQRDGAQVRMARRVHLAHPLVLFRRPRRVVHVAQVVLALHVVLVLPHELVLVVELQEQCKELEELDNDLVVAFLGG